MVEFKCNKCSLTYSTQNGLNGHMKIHKHPLFKCDNCGEKFDNEDRYNVHLDLCLKEYVCDKCKKVLIGKQKYATHLIYCNDPTFICPRCNREFYKQNDLNSHVKVCGTSWICPSTGYVRSYTEDGYQDYEHRIVMERKLGRKLTSEEIVHHKDKDKTNNDEDNLELTTKVDHPSHHTKLSKNDVLEIRKLLRNPDLTMRSIGNIFNVSLETIYDIKKRRSWNHI